MEEPDKFPDRLDGRVEFAGVLERVALDSGEGFAQAVVFAGQSHPEGAPAKLVAGEGAGLKPEGNLVAQVNQEASEGADQNDYRPRELQAEDEERQDQSDDRERAAAQDREQGPQPVRWPRRFVETLAREDDGAENGDDGQQPEIVLDRLERPPVEPIGSGVAHEIRREQGGRKQTAIGHLKKARAGLREVGEHGRLNRTIQEETTKGCDYTRIKGTSDPFLQEVTERTEKRPGIGTPCFLRYLL